MGETCQNRLHGFCVGRDEAAKQIQTEPRRWWLLLPRGSMPRAAAPQESGPHRTDSESTADEQLLRLAARL